MAHNTYDKVEARHLKRKAYLYVRQSTLRQVMENQESTKRQYALRDNAVRLGWEVEEVVVIDEDQGRSGASSENRTGFQRLVSDVGTGQAGLVMGLEFSRLARNSSDWHRLLEICALSDTLLLDEDGLYDPAHFNDRLLLGLKGTMSEAELHVLKARLQGGVRAKARRGELVCPLPTGFVYDSHKLVVLDPDAQVQAAIRLIFKLFAGGETACGVVKSMRKQELQLPMRQRHGPFKGELFWRDATHSRILDFLHNPRYAGTFFYGRCKQRRRADGKRSYEKLPQEQWIACKTEAHAGYLDWPTYQLNQKRLRDGAAVFGGERRAGPPREGAALLQGLVVCGRCGRRMTVSYHHHGQANVPMYNCQYDAIQKAIRPGCQTMSGKFIDAAVGRELVAAMTPLALELSLQVQKELETRHVDADAIRRLEVQRVQEQAELARRRYMQVDPDRRMVADALEADWNFALRALDQAHTAYLRWQTEQQATATNLTASQLAELSRDFRRLWADPATAQRDRKRMLALLVADVTLLREPTRDISIQVRYKTGVTKTLVIEGKWQQWYLRRTPVDTMATLNELLDRYTDSQTAEHLNSMGLQPFAGGAFARITVCNLRKDNRLLSHDMRLRARGMLSVLQMAANYGVHSATIRKWHRDGHLVAHVADDKGKLLFDPTDDRNREHFHHNGAKFKATLTNMHNQRNEV